MSQRLVGQRAFITAAGQGIGRAIAEAFVREGASVFATDLNPNTLAELRAATGCEIQVLDVTDDALFDHKVWRRESAHYKGSGGCLSPNMGAY